MKHKSHTELESDLLASEARYRDLVKETLAVGRRGPIDLSGFVELRQLDSKRRETLRETNRLLSELWKAPMMEIVLTCVSCGKSESVKDSPEDTRDAKCKNCGESMVLKRHPGNLTAT